MANDTQRDKARATFGKTFFENSKAQPQPKNSMSALQARANARPIPTFKVGGVVKKADGGKASKDFTGLMSQAAARAAKKGMPVMKAGGPSKEHMAKRIESRMEAGAYKKGGKVMCKADGGEAKLRYDRKMKDIEKDYKIALAKGKNEGVAKAKMEQRVADAKDDLAKWTKSDRSATSAAEKAAEAALTEARKTKGQSVMKRDAEKSFGRELEAKADMPKKMATTEMVSGIGKAPSLPTAKTERKVAMPERRQVPVRRQVQAPAAQRAAAPAAAPAAAARAPAAAPRAATPQVKSPGAAAASAGDEATRLRMSRAAQLEKSAAEKAALEKAPAGAKGAALARLKDVFGFGSSGDLAQARALRGQSAAAENIAKQRAAAAERAKAEEAARMQANAARVAKLRAAGDNMKADFYERNPRALKTGGKPGKYAAGGAGKVRKGMMKGK